MKKTPKEILFTHFINKRFSFTTIGGAVFVAGLFLLFSAGLVAEPTFLIYGAFYVLGSAAGLAVDELQNRLTN